MTNNTNTQEQTTLVLTPQVEKIKLIARDTLRMQLISPRLSRVSSIESYIAELHNQMKEIDHKIEVNEYEISKSDQNHPDYEKTKTKKEEKIKYFTTNKEDITKEITEENKNLQEQKDKITKIETGETKVNLEDLNDLVETLTIEYAKNQVRQ